MNRILSLFPFWAIAFALVGFFYPPIFAFMGSWIIWLLSIVMFGMGLTLVPADFKRVILRPFPILLTVFFQFLIMPLLAFALSKLFQLPKEIFIGMILVGSVSGGTSSNVMTYLAKGDTALSVSCTALSTILSVLVTPLLAVLYLKESIPVPAGAMLLSILRIVIIPVVLGFSLNSLFHKSVAKLENILPFISMLGILLIVAIVIALNQETLKTVGGRVFLAVIFHNLLGYTAGYFSAKAFRFEEKICRTVAFEIGMQNSGLGVSLAREFFSATAALPGALFSVWHNISGSLLAGYWRRKKEKK